MIKLSANVWFEEVDTGLIEEIKKTIKVKDQFGKLVPLSDDAVIVRKPEEDFKPESYPCVSIYNTNDSFDPLRYNPEPLRVARDVESNTITLEDSAVPFELFYQIDFWSRYQEDMNQMTKCWLQNHFRQFNLSVIDDGGTKRSCNCLKVGNPRKSDLILNKERLFHTIISYRIWVELDGETRYNVNMVTSTDFGVKPKEDNKEV